MPYSYKMKVRMNYEGSCHRFERVDPQGVAVQEHFTGVVDVGVYAGLAPVGEPHPVALADHLAGLILPAPRGSE